MSNQMNNAGITEDQIRQLETRLASAFNEKIGLVYAKSYKGFDDYYVPIRRVSGVFSYAIKEAYVKMVFRRAFEDPPVIETLIGLLYNPELLSWK
jgi:hypothetical protein